MSDRARDAVLFTLENIVLQGKTITDESTFRDLGLDSLDKVEMIMDLEDYFDGMHVNDDCLLEINTVGELIAHIETLL